MALIFHIAGFKTCPFYQKAANVVCAMNHVYPNKIKADVMEFPDRDSYRAWLLGSEGTDGFRNTMPDTRAHKHTSCPFSWVGDGQFVGGCDDTLDYIKGNYMGTTKRVPQVTVTDPVIEGDYDYDLIVIGGGSGGLACSKAAAGTGAKVAVMDFVKPSPVGTTWGLGGTCVNVGCIPKKLCHQAAILGHQATDAKSFGWSDADKGKHNWPSMITNIQDYIHSLNFKYKVDLRSNKVEYLNELGSFTGPHTISAVNKKGVERTISAKKFVIAVGGRPTNLDIPGGELALSSDDIFSLETDPGKTLCVGASYIALECAGFLTGLGVDTTVMVRSILLRGFDQDIAGQIGDYMEKDGTKFIKGVVPTKLEKTAAGRILVTFGDGQTDEYDTVLAAVGRYADTKSLNLESVGVKTWKNGKVIVDQEQTSAPHIYAIGDCICDKEGKPGLELTPVAIQAGELLSQRLYSSSTKAMDYDTVPTTVFTPLEYGSIGYSEEDALAKFKNDVEIYHAFYTPLEQAICEDREHDKCYVKLMCDKTDNGRVVGFHVLGPNAGEITQGFATAMKLGMTYDDVRETVGIHPTDAEKFTTLKVTKSSGEDAAGGGC